jgi:hypothetical protein
MVFLREVRKHQVVTLFRVAVRNIRGTTCGKREQFNKARWWSDKMNVVTYFQAMAKPQAGSIKRLE